MTPENKIVRFQRILLFALAGICWPVAAQQTNEPSSAFPPPPQPAAYSSPSVLSHATEPPRTDVVNEPLMQWGPVSLRPHLLYRFTYGDGIQSQPGQSEKTIIQEISPGILLELGTHFTLDYTPTISLYSSSRFRDTLSHNVNLTGSTSYENWVFGLSQTYNASSEPLVETGVQTDQEIYATALSASYYFSDEMWLDLGANQTFRLVDSSSNDTNNLATNFNGSREWSTLNWLNYQLFTGLNAGVGAGFGYVDAESGFDMTYEQFQGRLNWRPTEKISLGVNGGVEYRHFLNSDADVTLNPLYGAFIEYHPFEQTTLSLSANRRIGVSYFQNQITETTDVLLGLNQRLLGKLNLNVRYGYNTTRYFSSSDDLSEERDDETSFVDVRLSCAILKRATIAAFFHYGENTSSQSDFAYSSTQVGLEFGYRY